MSNGYDIVFPLKDPQFFDGGVNNKFERALISDNESPDALNVVFSDGAVQTRGGSTQLNTTSVGSFVCDGLYTRQDDTGAETMVAFFGGLAYTWTTPSFSTIGSAQSVFTAGVRVGAAQYEGHIFFGNGNVDPYKYDGTEWTRHGVPAPTSTLTVASNGTGALSSGDYLYKVTYVNSLSAEGDVGPVSTTFTVSAGGGQLDLTSIPVAPQSFGVATRRLYRTEVGGSTFKRVTEINDNSTTTYTDNIADSALGTTAPTDNGVPPNYSVVLYHQNRLFCNDSSNLNYVYYSDLGEPYTYPTTNFLKIGDNASDLVRGLVVYGNDVVVLCDKSTWLINMPTTTASDWSVIRIRSAYGCKSPFGTFLFEDKLMIPAMQNDKIVGFAAISGVNIDPESTSRENQTVASLLKSMRIEPDIFSIQESYVSNISAMVFKSKAYIAVTYGSGNTTNNRIFVYDFALGRIKKQEDAWVSWTGINAAQFTIYNQTLYSGSATANGRVYQLETDTYNDDGSAIDSYYWSKEFGGVSGQEEHQKDFRWVNMLVEKLGAYFMELRYRVDSDKGIGTQFLINLDPGSSLWGTMRWGTDTWGGGDDQEDVRTFLANASGKRIQYKFSNLNTANQAFKVHWLKFNYNIKGRR